MVRGVVLRSYQSQGFGHPWIAELWDESNAIRYYRTVRKFNTREEAEAWAKLQARQMGLAIVCERSGRFGRRILFGKGV